nr:alcohol dehydrogenase-like regulatory protein ErcA [uncultured Methanoregula sp.]
MRTFELRKFVAPEFIFGTGARHLAGRYANNFRAKKVLLVTDPGVLKTGLVDEVKTSLQDSGISYEQFAEVIPNPRSENVMTGAGIFQESGCSALVAVGGGSVIDCAKGIGIVSSNHRHITEFEGIDRVNIPSPPLICIPTTAGSSADVSQFAIITDSTRNIKMAIVSKTLVPDIALIDPETLLTKSPDLTAHTGLDVLTHAIEAYVSNASSPVTDLHALEAVRLIIRYLPGAVAEPGEIGYRGETMLASLHAGLAFSNASLGAVHAMAHALGGSLDLPHGLCNALLLDEVIRYNYPSTRERYDTIGEVMKAGMSGDETHLDPQDLPGRIKQFRKSLGVSDTLGSLGVSGRDIPKLAENALRDVCMATNPRRPNQQEIEAIYASAI